MLLIIDLRFLVHIYDDPVRKLDTIAQVMILLGIVCNFIMGLSGQSCDFIIGIVTLIVKMAMGMRLVKGTDGKETYDGNQSHILDQLLTSLYSALNQFNIDGQITMYAMCPACNCTYKPSSDPSATYARSHRVADSVFILFISLSILPKYFFCLLSQ